MCKLSGLVCGNKHVTIELRCTTNIFSNCYSCYFLTITSFFGTYAAPFKTSDINPIFSHWDFKLGVKVYKIPLSFQWIKYSYSYTGAWWIIKINVSVIRTDDSHLLLGRVTDCPFERSFNMTQHRTQPYFPFFTQFWKQWNRLYTIVRIKSLYLTC